MSIPSRIQQLHDHIRWLEQASHRKPNSVRLVAVSKGRSVDDILTAHRTGLTEFGENYYQEAQVKMAQLNAYPLNWHFLGPIQSNKAKGIAVHFNWVHSVCQARTALALNQHRPTTSPPLNVCIQINIDEEPSKAGVHEKESLALAQTILTLPRLRLRGLMVIPKPHSVKPFQRTAELLHTLNHHLNHSLDTLSMGMTDSLDEAIHAGATLVRVGRGIFGAPLHA